jgi:hypothetical protein
MSCLRDEKSCSDNTLDKIGLKRETVIQFFFQNRASHRRRKNTVRFLKRDDGSRCDTDDGMREMT